jgi:hypothetical protein
MSVMALEETSALAIERWARQSRTLTVFHFGDQEEEVWVPFSAGVWHRRLGTAETRFSGPGSNLLDEVVSGGRARLCMHPHSAAVYEMDRGE